MTCDCSAEEREARMNEANRSPGGPSGGPGGRHVVHKAARTHKQNRYIPGSEEIYCPKHRKNCPLLSTWLKTRAADMYNSLDPGHRYIYLRIYTYTYIYIHSYDKPPDIYIHSYDNPLITLTSFINILFT